MSSPFAKPAPPGEGIKWADLEGSLLIIDPISLETDIQTSYGSSDAVRARVSIVDGPQAGNVYEDTLIFPKVLSGQLKGHLGGKVLGRLTTGTAKPGQSAPWLLTEATEQDQAAAIEFMNRQAGQGLQQPAPAQQQPAQAQQQWQQAQQGQQPQQDGGNVPF
jgi:hypothetical protein